MLQAAGQGALQQQPRPAQAGGAGPPASEGGRQRRVSHPHHDRPRRPHDVGIVLERRKGRIKTLQGTG